MSVLTELHQEGVHFLKVGSNKIATKKGWKRKKLPLREVESSDPKQLAFIPGRSKLVVIDVDVHNVDDISEKSECCNSRVQAVVNALGDPICQYPTPGLGRHMVYRKPSF